VNATPKDQLQIRLGRIAEVVFNVGRGTNRSLVVGCDGHILNEIICKASFCYSSRKDLVIRGQDIQTGQLKKFDVVRIVFCPQSYCLNSCFHLSERVDCRFQ